MSNYSRIDKRLGLRTVFRLITIFLLMLVITASSALAAVEITPAEVILNVDYGDLKDEDQTVIRRTFDIPVRNTETMAVVVSASITGLPSRYNAPTINTATIQPGETRMITVTIDIPQQQSSGRRQIGVIEVKNANTLALYDTALLIQDTKKMLAIDEISVEYEDLDGETERETFNGEDPKLGLDESIRPGSPVTISFKDIENLFDHDYDEDSSDIEDITLTIEADDEDLFKGNFEEEYDLGALGAEDSQDFEVSFIVDEEADEGAYVLTIELVGEDGEGAKHAFKTELTLELDRNKDDIRITKWEILPENPTSCDKKVIFNTEIKNVGTRSQNDVSIQLYSPSLEILQNIPDLKLNRFSKDDHSYSRSFSIDFSSKEIAAGRHDVEFNVFLDGDQVDHQRKTLAVGDCPKDQTNVPASEEQKKSGEELESEDKLETSAGRAAEDAKARRIEADKTTISSSKIVSIVEDPYTNEDVLLSLIIISLILLLAVIAIFTVIIIKTKSEVPKK